MPAPSGVISQTVTGETGKRVKLKLPTTICGDESQHDDLLRSVAPSRRNNNDDNDNDA